MRWRRIPCAMGEGRVSPASPGLSASMARRAASRALWRVSCLPALLLASIAPVLAESADKIGAARASAIRKLDLQLDFPKPAAPPSIDWGNWNVEIPPAVIWALLAIGAALALWWLSRSILAWPLPRRAKPATAASESTPDETAAEPGLAASAEALARAGRYAEAMHELLLRGLAELRLALAEPFADSFTSREILRRTRLAPQGRQALAEIVARVELSHFGRRQVGEDDYRACRRSFDTLGAALAGTRE